MAPHLYPSILGCRVLPDGIIEIALKVGIPTAAQAEFTTPRACTESYRGEQVRPGYHLQEVVQVRLDAWVHLVGRGFGEQARARDRDIVGARGRETGKILLGIGRTDWSGTLEFEAIQFWDHNRLPDVRATQVRSVDP
jgi:hypothetical protein